MFKSKGQNLQVQVFKKHENVEDTFFLVSLKLLTD